MNLCVRFEKQSKNLKFSIALNPFSRKTLIISFFYIVSFNRWLPKSTKDRAVTDNPTQTQQIAKVVNVSPDEFMDLQKSGAVTIDVRTQEEVNDGYIDGQRYLLMFMHLIF